MIARLEDRVLRAELVHQICAEDMIISKIYRFRIADFTLNRFIKSGRSGKGLVFEANYTWNKTVRLWRDVNSNAPVLPA